MRRTAMAVAMAGLASVAAAPVYALELEVHGSLDLRVAQPADETSWTQGGLGKTRFGGGGDAASDDALSGRAALTAAIQMTPALLATTSLQYQPELERQFDVLEGFVRYRPVSTTPWRWSAKAGAFFPPVSQEHDGLAWSTTRTLTPSAVNTWVGEELRIFGAELHVEHRGRQGTLDARAAVFFKNDPAGELLASRGWALGDIATGIDGSLRQPDVHAPVARAPVPMRFRPFVEMDDRPGFYGVLGWQPSSQRRFTALYYDNHADLAESVRYSGRTLRAWRTYFWNLGGEQRFGEWALLAQAMHGSTIFEPVPGRLRLDTDFNAGYLMLAREEGAWQPALRVDLFQTRQRPAALTPPLSEHGNALTLALNWRPSDAVRLTGEVLRIDSSRNQRRLDELDARQVDVQVQLGLRLFF
ncbi:hypothetical protein [Agrilutibacter solisilvae]|uniref:Porin n=1 Tax=Agrilutibacter solisilvae TaxID=2763317 RepID=A0A974XZY0_9GAMM|nr:hypothetical protein [Lysobacter solisilvae]QSX77910.1 hypothetical protein I8J32_014460 [Lysobacter solisilvae]